MIWSNLAGTPSSSVMDGVGSEPSSLPGPALGRARRQLGQARELLEQLALRAGVVTTSALGHRNAVRLGGSAGALYGTVARTLATRDHRVAAKNLSLAFPAKSAEERDEILCAMWRHWGRALAEMGRLRHLDRETLRELVQLDPSDAAREIFAHAQKTGVLVLTAHFGSFELLHAACAAHGYPITVVHRTLANQRVDRWLTALRERNGTRVLRTGSAARPILRALRCGEVVAVPFDQRPRDASRVFAPFFSAPAATSSGLARLALASNAPVYPVVLVRDGESERHRAVFAPAVPLVRTGDRERDVVENTARFNEALESLVRAHPPQWIWMYSRWKEHLKGRVPAATPVQERRAERFPSFDARQRGATLGRGRSQTRRRDGRALSADRTP